MVDVDRYDARPRSGCPTTGLRTGPPTFASVKGDRKNLTLYIAALKKWSRVGGVEKKDQAETVMYHASQTCPAYFEELEVKFGETLEGKEEGITEIVKYLEAKFGVSQHSEIVRKLNTFFWR